MHEDDYANKYPHEMTDEELAHAIEMWEERCRWCESNKFRYAQAAAAQTLYMYEKEKFKRKRGRSEDYT